MAKKSSTPDETQNTEEHDVTEIQTENVNYAKCGGALKEERLKQGLSVGDICTQLRLSTTQIEALEADHFSKLPQPTIVRGFIRNYAKALQIDAAPILAVYQQLNPETVQQSLTVKETADSSIIGDTKSGFSPKIFIALITLFGLVGGGYYYYTQHIQLANKNEAIAEASEAEAMHASGTETNSTEFSLQPSNEQALTESPATQSNDTVAEIKAANTQTSTAEIEVSLPAEQVTTLTLDKKVPVVESTQKEIAAANDVSNTEAETEKPQPIKGYAQLEVATTAATWINVTNYYTGKKIFSEIVPANTTKTISAKKPFNMIIGNAPQTTLSIDGETFDLVSKTRNKIAKLSVK